MMQVNRSDYRKNGKGHLTIYISETMDIEVEKFLKTNAAFNLGFDSKADVVTAAVRNLLLECGQYERVKSLRG